MKDLETDGMIIIMDPRNYKIYKLSWYELEWTGSGQIPMVDFMNSLDSIKADSTEIL